MRTPEVLVDRRSVLRRAGGGLALLVLAPLAEGCGKKVLSCVDTSGISFADAQARVMLAYNDRAVDPTKPCRTCKQFRSAGEEACGQCAVLKGPINPAGGCHSWAART